MKIYNDISKTTGNTPLLRLNRIAKDSHSVILCKLEFFNPTSSIKDRVAVNMIDAAEKKGLLKPGATIIEPTSGNTGLGLAMVAAARAYRLIITMPENMSVERRMLLQHLGAELVLTSEKEGMAGAVEKALKLAKEIPGAFVPQQFENPANTEAHHNSTAVEIWNDTDGKVDIFVAGVGTGGTLTGVASYLKEKNPSVRIIAVEPESSAVISGGTPGRHGIQGIGAGFIPKILDTSLIDETVKISDNEALATARDAARFEGILCGISSGAAIAAALKIGKQKENKNKTIVVIVPDTGERYMSTKLFS